MSWVQAAQGRAVKLTWGIGNAQSLALMETINYVHYMGETGETTKDRLLATAERLFAEYGIEAVSPRQIALAAGQLNQSAIRYHFGTKEALVEALLLRRMAEINRRRRLMLEDLENAGRLDDLRALVEAVAFPLAEKVRQTPGDGHYVRFLAHLFADRERRDVLIGREREAAPLRRIYRMLRTLTPELPEPIWSERLRLVVGGVIYALADRERLRAIDASARDALPDTAFVNNLVDIGVAILSAPLSTETLRGLARDEKETFQEDAHADHG